MLATRDQAAAELDLLDTADTDLRALAARRAAAEGALRTAAEELSDQRREAASVWREGSTVCCRSWDCRAGSYRSSWCRWRRLGRTGRRACS